VFNGHTDTVGSVMLRSEVRGSTQPCCVCVLQGADAGCVNKEGLPALHVAVFNGHADAVAALVDDGGADVNVQGPTSGNTALHEAVLLGPSLSRVIDALLTYVSPESNTHTHTHARTHAHTHTHPFNGPLSRTTRVSRYQKGTTNLDFTEAREAVASAGPYASQHLAPYR